jgi:phosphoribosylamine--glycine ligase
MPAWDPETEAVMLRIKSDFVDLLVGAAEGTLRTKSIEIDSRSAATVMLVSGGYPGSYEKGKIIGGLDQIEDSIAFHAGTSSKNGHICTDGGRVIAISSYGQNMNEALARSYKNAEKITFDGMYYRKDLGFDLQK